MTYLNVYLTVEIGLDVLASAKRAEFSMDGAFKIPRERVASVVASLDEDDDSSMSSGIDEVGRDVSEVARKFGSRKYRESGSTGVSKSGTFVFLSCASKHSSVCYCPCVIY